MTSNTRVPKAEITGVYGVVMKKISTKMFGDVAEPLEVPRWRESDVFTPLERDVMDCAEAMSQTPPTVTDELSARLLER